ncbi:ribosomal maturation YjgA family protein [Kitasatospora griseola]|uniref:ribosomal maturation YjgA family protein n=1 Tax=Kitasatospora griseola TaxID=2064 RepID=UPI0038299934
MRTIDPSSPHRPTNGDELMDRRREWKARAGWLLAAAAVLGSGLVAPGLLPAAAGALLGGALYTALLHTLLMTAAPRLRPWTAGAAALAASWAVELFQLTGVPESLAVRSRPARLALGTTFDASDLLGYTLGALAAVAAHLAARRIARRIGRRPAAGRAAQVG